MNVQLENGYLRIANDLMDALLSAPISGRQMKVIMAVIRKTYGFNKKTDDIGLSQLRDITGIDRSNLSRAIASLVEANVLTKKDGSYAHNIGLNKHFATWVFDGWEAPETVAEMTTPPLPKWQHPCCRNDNTPVAEMTTPLLPNRQPQKTTPKDNSKRQLQKAGAIPSPDFGGDELRLAWIEFVQHRAEIKKPLTRLAAQKNIAILAGKQNPVAVIEQTIANGWVGLFDVKEQKFKPANSVEAIGGIPRHLMLGYEELQP